MTSASLTNMAARLDEVRALAGEDPARKDPRSSADVLSGAINRACILLLSAHLEGYVEDVVIEALDRMLTESVCVDDLPLLLRALHAEDHLERLSRIYDRKARAPRIRDLIVGEMGLWEPGATLRSEMIRSGWVVRQMSNPGERGIQSFLELIGVDLKDWLEQCGERRLLGEANGLVALRNGIAHGDVTRNVTRTDVDGYISTVDGLARTIDEAIADALMGTCGMRTRPW